MLIVVGPALIGYWVAWAYTRSCARKGKLGFLRGLFMWVLTLIASLGGDLLGRYVFSSAYSEIGDNPTQVAGIMLTWMGSLIVCPALWIVYSYRVSRAKPETPNK